MLIPSGQNNSLKECVFVN